MGGTLVRLEGVAKSFLLGGNTIHALENIDLSIEAGEFLSIVGPSGSGKTTLLGIIGCIEKASSGKVEIEGRDVAACSADETADLRAGRMGFIFQTFNLLPVLTAAENVEFPLLRSGLPRRERREKALAALSEVGLEKFSSHKPAQLSGGQRQRVAIARAMANSPALVLADEPTANLDHKTGLDIIALMKDINRKRKTTFIFSTHDPKVVSQAGRVVQLMDGNIIPG